MPLSDSEYASEMLAFSPRPFGYAHYTLRNSDLLLGFVIPVPRSVQNILHPLFGIGSAYVAAKRKAPLSILHLNMESWSFPSNHDQAKDAWPNSVPATYGVRYKQANIIFIIE